MTLQPDRLPTRFTTIEARSPWPSGAGEPHRSPLSAAIGATCGWNDPGCRRRPRRPCHTSAASRSTRRGWSSHISDWREAAVVVVRWPKAQRVRGARAAAARYVSRDKRRSPLQTLRAGWDAEGRCLGLPGDAAGPLPDAPGTLADAARDAARECPAPERCRGRCQGPAPLPGPRCATPAQRERLVRPDGAVPQRRGLLTP